MTSAAIDLGGTCLRVGYAVRDGLAVVRSAAGTDAVPAMVWLAGPADVRSGAAAVDGPPGEVVTAVRADLSADPRATARDRYFHGRFQSPVSVTGYLLAAAARSAGTAAGTPVRDVLLGVPAAADDSGELRRAATAAGLTVADFIAEPVAVALHYDAVGDGVDHVTVVHDLGGTTLDVTVLRIRGRGVAILRSTRHAIGGSSWDGLLARQILAEAGAGDRAPDADARRVAERLRVQLSDSEQASGRLAGPGIDRDVHVDRARLEDATAHLLGQVVELTRTTIDEAVRVSGERPDSILLAGGASRMPMIARALGEGLGLEVRASEPQLAVVRGLALAQNFGLLFVTGQEGDPLSLPPAPLPRAAGPEQRAVDPEPPAVDPEPHVADPEPQVADPEPQVADPEPQVADPEPQVADPEPQVADPEPQVADPEPQVADPEPQVADPEPQVADPEPQVADPEPQVADPEPQVADPEPQVADPEPQARDEAAAGSVRADALRAAVAGTAPPRPAPPAPPPPPRRRASTPGDEAAPTAAASADRDTGGRRAPPPGAVPVGGPPDAEQMSGRPVEQLRALRRGDRLLLTWDWPADSVVAQVRWYSDGNGPGRAGTARCSKRLYIHEGGFELPAGRDGVTITVEALVYGGPDGEPPSPLRVEPAPPAVTYDLAVRRRGPRRWTVTVTFTSDVDCVLPPVLVVLGTGNYMPESTADGEVIHVVPKQSLATRLAVTATFELAARRGPCWLVCLLDDDGTAAPAELRPASLHRLRVN